MKPLVISLKLNKEFKRAYYQGKFKAHPFLVSYVVKNREGKLRIGITTAKKVGCAVKRNRARRIIRQAYRELLRDSVIPLNGGYDLVFVARVDTPAQKCQDVKRIMKKHLEILSSK